MKTLGPRRCEPEAERRTGRHGEAEPAARHALGILRTSHPPGSWQTAKAACVLGAALAGLDGFEEAEDLLLGSYPAIREDRGDDHPWTREALRRIVSLYESWGKPDEAGRYRALLTASTPRTVTSDGT